MCPVIWLWGWVGAPDGLSGFLLVTLGSGQSWFGWTSTNGSLLGASPQGFQVLVEMEWLDFGHKFADRCGHGENSDDLNERCPVFLQWLDCVHQLQRQFPCSFEFNEAFLVSLCL